MAGEERMTDKIVCDKCGADSLEAPRRWFWNIIGYSGPGWVAIGDYDLCPICSEKLQKIVSNFLGKKVKI
jgi:hypothetical protein